jgi:hypothetical protein
MFHRAPGVGWSQRDPAKEPHSDSALFGGWRIEDMEKKREGDEWGVGRDLVLADVFILRFVRLRVISASKRFGTVRQSGRSGLGWT